MYGNMKIVIQRGDVINRNDVEHLFQVMPSSINSLVDSFIVYASNDNQANYQYFNKQKSFYFYSPKDLTITKKDALSEIAAHLFAALDIGHIPDKLSSSKLQHYKTTWTELCTNHT